MKPNSKMTINLINSEDYNLNCKAFSMDGFDRKSLIVVDQAKQLTVSGASSPADCGEVVLDAHGQGIFFTVGYDESGAGTAASLMLQGLTLRNTMGGHWDIPQSAVSVYKGNLTVKDCAFEVCSSDNAGGAAINSVGHSTMIHNCTFTNCSSSVGGGAVCVSGNATISDSSFTNCRAGSSPGGAVLASGTTTVTSTNFTGCSAGSAPGGAVNVAGKATFTNCIFADNTCYGCGGAPAGGAIIGDPTLEGCKFVVPANPSAGNNDLFGSATFACPPGTKGTPVTLPGGPHLIKQLPPSTEIVHCA
jgi:hypothetical protein